MSTFTIILLVYVILDIVLDTTAIILLRRRGFSLKSIAFKIKELLTFKVPLRYDEEDMAEYDKECDSWDGCEEDPYTDDHYEKFFYDEDEELKKTINKVTENE